MTRGWAGDRTVRRQLLTRAAFGLRRLNTSKQPKLFMTRRQWPCVGARSGVGMLMAPPTRQHPTRMRDDQHGRFRRLRISPAVGPGEHRIERLAATGCGGGERGTPLVHFSAPDVVPLLALPAPEIHLEQRCIDDMFPAPAPQPTTDVRAAPQGRGVNFVRQAVTARCGLDASRQTLGATPVHAQIRVANAATGRAFRTGVAPGPYGLRCPRWRSVSHKSEPSAPPPRSTARWHQGCRRCSHRGALAATGASEARRPPRQVQPLTIARPCPRSMPG